ncbi:hypothetical protein AB0A60_34850, partial [Streptomyces sp. NPDC046275]|uniref:hypothetical protein n=1 Tax=Streptomyces sp. NPDC046275 TaxID=3157201 RepID=UPI0033F0448C
MLIEASRERPSTSLQRSPTGAHFGMPEFVPKRLDYEPSRKSAKVVDTPEGLESESNRDRKAPRKSDRKDLIESETQERRKRPEESP